MKIIQYPEIKYLTVQRTTIETDLAKNLYALFNSPPIITTLRHLISLVLENMFYFIDFAEGKPFSKEAKNLTVFERFPVRMRPQRTKSMQEAINRSKLLTVFEKKDLWSASDCSDLIRLFAAIIEEQPSLKTQPANVDDFNKYKPPDTFEKVPAGLDSANKIPDIATKKNIRWRTKEQDVKTEPLYQVPPKHIEKGRDQIEIERLIVNAKAGKRSSAFWGIKDVRLMPASTIRKIDIAFGLPQGCDISGTTSDSILIVNRVISFFQEVGENVAGDKIPVAVLQLIPLVTMVSLGHHTLLESACTLTLSKFIEYSIGFYSTLLPDRQPLKAHDTATLSKINGYLRQAESNFNNQHFLCFKAHGGYNAYLFDKPSEIMKFKAIAKADYKLLNFFNAASPLVTHEDILRFFKVNRWTPSVN